MTCPHGTLKSSECPFCTPPVTFDDICYREMRGMSDLDVRLALVQAMRCLQRVPKMHRDAQYDRLNRLSFHSADRSVIAVRNMLRDNIERGAA